MATLVKKTFNAGGGDGSGGDGGHGDGGGCSWFDVLPSDVCSVIDEFYNQLVYKDVVAEVKCEVGINTLPSCWVDKPTLYHKLHEETCLVFRRYANGNTNVLSWWLEYEPNGDRCGIDCDLLVRIGAQSILHTWNNALRAPHMVYDVNEVCGIEAFCLMFDYQTLLDLKRCLYSMRWCEE